MSLLDALKHRDNAYHRVDQSDTVLPWDHAHVAILPLCGLCRKRFKVGDMARWVLGSGVKDWTRGSFFVCEPCDRDFAVNVERRIAKMALKLIKEQG